jgi:glycosyltransferase involved in cell wall biosynthesis
MPKTGKLHLKSHKLPDVYWLAFGTYDTEAHPRVAALIDGVRAHGYQLVELNAPLGLGTAARVRLLQQPWRLPHLGYRLARCWARLARQARALARTGRVPDVVLVGYLGHFDVLLARRLFPRSRIVLDHLVSAAATAADRGSTDRIRQRLLRALDRAALRSADVIVVDTDVHRDRLPPLSRHQHARPARTAVVTPVGATDGWFAARRPEALTAGAQPLRVIFFGLFTPLHGATVIAEAAALLAGHPGITVTLVGTGQQYARCRALADRASVTWLDWVPGAQLPELVAGHDVCLGVFGDTEKGRSVVPTKVFQGAAAGCAIVTSDTPPQRAALADAARYTPPGDPAALAAVLSELAADRTAVAALRRAAADRADREFTAYAVTDALCRVVDRPAVHASAPAG